MHQKVDHNYHRTSIDKYVKSAVPMKIYLSEEEWRFEENHHTDLQSSPS